MRPRPPAPRRSRARWSRSRDAPPSALSSPPAWPCADLPCGAGRRGTCPGLPLALPASRRSLRLTFVYFLTSFSNALGSPSAYFRLLPYCFFKFARLAFGCASHYITGPMIHGANSSSPTPDSSLLLCLPDATATISSKICRPTSGSGVPSRITPQLMSMSSDMWRYIRLLVASLIDGTGLQPNTEPRPVVKQIMLQPPATRPVIDTG